MQAVQGFCLLRSLPIPPVLRTVPSTWQVIEKATVTEWMSACWAFLLTRFLKA